MKKTIVFLFFSAFILLQNLFAQGCSQCKMMAEQGSELEEGAFGKNINSGILYLMIIPYLILMFLFRKQLISLTKQYLFKKKTA
jgi:hypothetical protein